MIHPVPTNGFLPAILLLVLLASACGDGEAVPSPNPTVGGPTPVLEGAAATFLDLLTEGLDSTYKVTYQTTTPQGNRGDTTIVVHRPPLTRIDTIPSGSSVPSALIIGGDADTLTISCSGGPDQWECIEIEPLGDSLLIAAGPFVFVDATEVASYAVSETESRTIAGQAARCFRLIFQEAESGEEIDYCFSDNGVPLYGAPLFGTVEATEFSTDASDEDFVSPVEPQ